MTSLAYKSSFLPISVLITGLIAPNPADAISDRRIEDARYACTTFIDGEDKSKRKKDIDRARLARFWLVGFLTGAYEADAVLEFSEDEGDAESVVISRVKEYCEENRDNSIHAAAVWTGASPKPLPASTAVGFDPRQYSCGAYSEGRDGRGDARSRAEAAEFWAFAFVQGTVSVRHHPRLVISVANKRKIVRALKQSCARNPTRTLLDQTAEIATRVRPLPER
ncbi:MAG: hypothetical protein GKS03_04385 [Alphaproteobacteria bacterium]|nr:hypothetical protein [Alphaproteobacteria bacterium]